MHWNLILLVFMPNNLHLTAYYGYPRKLSLEYLKKVLNVKKHHSLAVMVMMSVDEGVTG